MAAADDRSSLLDLHQRHAGYRMGLGPDLFAVYNERLKRQPESWPSVRQNIENRIERGEMSEGDAQALVQRLVVEQGSRLVATEGWDHAIDWMRKHCDGLFRIVARNAPVNLLKHEARSRLDAGTPWSDVKAWVHEAAHSEHDPDSVVESLRTPTKGMVIDGKYEISSELERGGFGNTWQACRHPGGGVYDLVVKLLQNEHLGSRDTKSRFEQECRQLERLTSRGCRYIAQYESHGVWRDVPYLTSRLVGMDSTSATRYCDNNRLSLRGRIELFRQMVEGVGELHHYQLAHRDLSPSNILAFTDPNGTPSIRIIDLGLAKVCVVASQRRDSAVVTALGNRVLRSENQTYVSPEQIWDSVADRVIRTEADWQKTDVYALGIILYELLYGAKPCWPQQQSGDPQAAQEGRRRPPRPRISRVRRDDRSIQNRAKTRGLTVAQFEGLLCDEKIWRFVRELMSYEPDDRPSVKELLETVQKVLKGDHLDTERLARSRRSSIAQGVDGGGPGASSEESLRAQKSAARKRKEAKGPNAQIVEDDVRECDALLLKGGSSADYLRELAKGRLPIWRAEAELGNFDAIWLLGRCYQEALGVEQSLAEAVKCFQTGADANEPRALFSLGLRFERGEGVPQDKAKAVELYTRATARGWVHAACALGVMYDNGEGVEVDKKRAAELYQQAADQGHVGAQFNLGLLYDNGDGVEVDKKKAAELYQKAADQGHVGAQFCLGLTYDNGDGVEVDKKRAAELYQKAADQGDADAQLCLGLMYDTGDGVDVDKPKAAGLYQKAADQDNADAQFCLGAMYSVGDGVEVDKPKAAELYQKAADQGDADAQFFLGLMYFNGDGVDVDKPKAAELFQKAADQDDVDAQFNLGWMYFNGDGVDADKPKAAELFQKAADQGDADAQFNLGLMYFNGDGIEVDKKRAAEVFQKAADQGYVGAQFCLGLMYDTGDGVEVDKPKAAELYQRAADQGRVDAQFNLGRMYFIGDSVNLDKRLAAELFTKAADQGDAQAQNILGCMYLNGDGIHVNEVKAAGLFAKAAHQGHGGAHYKLAMMYILGAGIQMDRKKAQQLFRDLLGRSSAEEMEEHGANLLDGPKTAMERAWGIRFLKAAAAEGHAGAKEQLATLKNRPNPQNIGAKRVNGERSATRQHSDMKSTTRGVSGTKSLKRTSAAKAALPAARSPSGECLYQRAIAILDARSASTSDVAKGKHLLLQAALTGHRRAQRRIKTLLSSPTVARNRLQSKAKKGRKQVNANKKPQASAKKKPKKKSGSR
jgi:TPR repeat protein/serine/threonine protein kinase